ncbi:TPA: glucosyltransferase domain-containing protein [Escherichia coli]|nr:glucosyltransferase domain-containing protein [Escherichia coli]
MKNKYLLMIPLAFILPIILGGNYYVDDINRSHLGYGWAIDGRPLSDLIYNIITFGTPITDFFPFSQIISVITLTYVGYLFSKSMNLDDDILILSSSIIATSPMAIEILSYRFDSLPISLSILLVFIPLIFKGNNVAFLILSTSLLLISLFIYQNSIFLYPVAALIIAANSVTKGSNSLIESIKFLSISLLSFVLSIVLYKFLSYYLTLNFNGRDEVIGIDHFFYGLVNNYEKFINIILLPLFNSGYFYYLLPLISILSISVLHNFFIYRKNHSALVVAVFFTILAIIISPGSNLILSDPWFTPRTSVGISLLLYIPLIFIGIRVNKLIKLSYTILLFFSFVLCSSYASALKADEQRRIQVINLVQGDVLKVEDPLIVINGSMPRSPVYYELAQKFPIIYKLSPNYMSNSWSWGVSYLRVNGIASSKSYPEKSMRNKVISEMCSFEIIKKNKILTLMRKGDVFVIDFEHKC